MAAGNHEFDNPSNVLKKQMAWMRFPLLSANVYELFSGLCLLQPYKVEDYAPFGDVQQQ